ncbi:MAG: oligoendopeptidase F family protein, partial [Gammaproteobacteria bacterium]|nr:oligoendopeptidase F family protein [Gammaproteobacteria bacterium]
MQTKRVSALLVFTLLTGIAVNVHAQSDAVRYEWDLTDIYPTVEAWEGAISAVTNRLDALSRYRGTLDNGASELADALEAQSDTTKEAYRVYVYTSLMRDVDQREPAAQARFARARQMLTNLEQATSWLRPEILDLGADNIRSFRQQEPRLEKFGFMLEDILRQEPHTLDQRTEAILAQAGMVLSAPQQIYENYANADIPWPTVTLSDGTEATLSQAGYSFWRAAPNRDDRKLVFDTFWGAWNQYADGMGATLAAEAQANVFSARVRNHPGVLEANLFADGLPPEIYTQLVNQVNDALPLFNR